MFYLNNPPSDYQQTILINRLKDEINTLKTTISIYNSRHLKDQDCLKSLLDENEKLVDYAKTSYQIISLCRTKIPEIEAQIEKFKDSTCQIEVLQDILQEKNRFIAKIVSENTELKNKIYRKDYTG